MLILDIMIADFYENILNIDNDNEFEFSEHY